jgi:hypothetical protein
MSDIIALRSATSTLRNDRDVKQAQAYCDLEDSINEIVCMSQLCWDACFNALARSKDDRANPGFLR